MRHPVGVALASDLLLVSEYCGGRLQVLRPDDGAALQVIREPFGTACLGALGADATRVVLTDTESRLHCFEIARPGATPASVPAPAPELEDDPLALAPARDPAAEEAARVAALRATLAGRLELAVEAADYGGVLDTLTKEDVQTLMPAAYAHAASHPELYSFPPVRSADELVADYELHLEGRAPPLGPPH